MSSKIYNYLSGIQTKGMYARREDKEKALSYAEKAAIAKKEEEKQINEIERQLRSQYSGNRTTLQRLSFKTTYLHYKFGGGRPLYVDISGMHIPSISASKKFNNEIGREEWCQTYSLKELNTFGFTVGNAKFRYLGNNKVELVGHDRYDFDIRKDASLQRNIATILGSIVHNFPIPSPLPQHFIIGTPYDLHLIGQATINP